MRLLQLRKLWRRPLQLVRRYAERRCDAAQDVRALRCAALGSLNRAGIHAGALCQLTLEEAGLGATPEERASNLASNHPLAIPKEEVENLAPTVEGMRASSATRFSTGSSKQVAQRSCG